MIYSHKQITRAKNVSNSENGRAYLDDLEKEFILHYPDRFRNSIIDTGPDEIILLYQKNPVKGPRYLTHLVSPIDKEIVETGLRSNFQFGHIVKTIAFTSDQNMIPFKSTKLTELNFNNRAWGNAQRLETITGKDRLEEYQKHIWNLFLPYFRPELNEQTRNLGLFLNDELQYDYETKEGKINFELHRIRERDSRLTALKKQQALKEGNFNCEVCDFSFLDFYHEEYLECHHRIPIHLGVRITKIEDLALVCANCHRMLHRKIDGKYLSVDELKRKIGHKT